MKTKSAMVALIVIGAGVGAAADPSEKYDDAARIYSEIKRDGRNLTPESVGKCKALIAEAKKDSSGAPKVIETNMLEGIPKAYKGGRMWELKVGDADQICTAVEKLALQLTAIEDLNELIGNGEQMGRQEVGGAGVTKEGLAAYTKAGEKCAAAIATLKSSGATEAKTSAGTMPVADIQTKICAKYDDDLKKFKTKVAETEAAAKKWWDEHAAPYKKLGVEGEKLDYLVGNEAGAMFGVGGKELTTPKEKAAAKVIFRTLTDDSGAVTIKRTAFSGNKITGESQKEYATRPGNAAFK